MVTDLMVVIENLEPRLSPWLKAEYEYCVSLFPGNVVFTNVSDELMFKELSKHAKVFSEGIAKVREVLGLRKVVVLDPAASEELRSEDLSKCDAVVIGGIMGDYPPKGRTWKLITSKLNDRVPRNLGKKQLTIAGAAYVLKKIMEGSRLKDIEFIDGITVSIDLNGAELEIYLPYRFPAVNGKPVLPKDYLNIVARKSIYYESIIMNDEI